MTLTLSHHSLHVENVCLCFTFYHSVQRFLYAHYVSRHTECTAILAAVKMTIFISKIAISFKVLLKT